MPEIGPKRSLLCNKLALDKEYNIIIPLLGEGDILLTTTLQDTQIHYSLRSANVENACNY